MNNLTVCGRKRSLPRLEAELRLMNGTGGRPYSKGRALERVHFAANEVMNAARRHACKTRVPKDKDGFELPKGQHFLHDRVLNNCGTLLGLSTTDRLVRVLK